MYRFSLQTFSILGVLLSACIMPYLVFAQVGDTGPLPGDPDYVTPNSRNTLDRLERAGEASGYDASADGGNLSALIANIINIFLGIFGLLLFLLILYAGFEWMTAGGDSKKVTHAKDTIRNAIIGIIVIIFAYAISNFVIDAVTSTTDDGGGGGGGDELGGS